MLRIVMQFLVIYSLSSTAHSGWDPNVQEDQPLINSHKTITNFMNADPSMQIFFDRAYGYAVFPSVKKGGAGIGGAFSNGIVFENGSEIGSVTLFQVTLGLQLGGQIFSEIIFFKDQTALYNFQRGTLKLAAQTSAVAVAEGISANLDYSNGVAIFTLSENGYMFEASVGGQRFSYQPQ